MRENLMVALVLLGIGAVIGILIYLAPSDVVCKTEPGFGISVSGEPVVVMTRCYKVQKEGGL